MLGHLVRRANRRLLPGRLLVGPDWLVMGVNNACNLHCRMCDVGTGFESSNFQHHLTVSRPMNMPLALAHRAVDQVALHFPRAQLGYAFTEPLIWPHLAASIAYATGRAVRTAVTTNGLKLPERAGELADAGLGTLAISLDGPAAVHDSIRRKEGSFAAAHAGITLLAAREKRPKMSVYCAITPWNTTALRGLLADLRGLPLEGVGFMHPNYTTRGMADAQNAAWPYTAAESNLADMSLADVDITALHEEITAIRSATWPWPVTFSPDLSARSDLHDFYHHPERRFGRACTDVFRNLMLKSDGTVIPAHGRCYRVVAGNLENEELDVLWNAPALARFRADLTRAGGLMPACTRCCSAFG